MKASRRLTMIDAGDEMDHIPLQQQRRMSMRDQVSVAQHSTITTDTLASFRADPGKNERVRGIQDAEMVSTLRWKQKEEAGAAIQALNQFIFVAGHTFKGRQLDEKDQKQLCDAAQQVGLSLDVVHALVEQTSDPNAILHYCLASSDAFATRMKNDPQLSLLLQQNARNVDRNGFDVADSVWRIFMHKIIQQFLKEHDMQLSDVMTKESLTRRLYEEAMRNEKKSSVDYGNDQIQISVVQRDYTKERERLKISEEEAKLARQQAEANMSFAIHRSLFGPSTRDSEDYFVSSDQIITTDDMLSLMPGIYPVDDGSITILNDPQREANQPSKRVVSLPEPTPKVNRRRKPVASDGEEEVSAVKRGLAMFEKGQMTPHKDTQRPPRKSLEALKQSHVQASKATFEGGQHERTAVEQLHNKNSSRDSLTGLREATVLKSKERFECHLQESEKNDCNQRLLVRSTTNKLPTSATNPFTRPDMKEQINVQKLEKSRADDVDVAPSKANFVKSARERFERKHAGEASEGESKPGRPLNSLSDTIDVQQSPQQRNTPQVSRQFSIGDACDDTETFRQFFARNHQIIPESFLDRPDYVVEVNSDDSNGVISALTQSASSSPEDDRSKAARRSSKSCIRRKSRPMILESQQQGESSVPFPRSMRDLIAEMNEGLMRQDMIGREQSQSDFATETTDSHPGYAKNSFLHNNYTSTDDSTLSRLGSRYKENHSQNLEGVSSSFSRSKHSGYYRESRQYQGEGRSASLNLQRAVPHDHLLSRRLDEGNHFDGEDGWVEFDNGFIKPPRTTSFGGRSGRGLSEGDNDSLRQPSDKKTASKTESTSILSEIRGIENGATLGKKEETRLSLVEQAENWSRRVRTLLSDEEQPSTPRFNKVQRTDDPSIFRDTTRINKENSAVTTNTGGWTNFEDSPFVGTNDRNPRTESKAKAPEVDRSATSENRPRHQLNSSIVSASKPTPSKNVSSSLENTTQIRSRSVYNAGRREMEVPRSSSERENKPNHGMSNNFQHDSSVVVWSQDTHHASQRPHEELTTNRPIDRSRGLNFEKKQVFSVDKSDEIYGDTSREVWSADRDHTTYSNELTRLRDSPKLVTKPSDSDLSKPYGRVAGNQNVAYGKISNQLRQFRQEQSFDETRSTSSESDFDAVNAYNECDNRRIENIQASELVRTLGTSTIPLYGDHGSYGRAHPQQPMAPLLSNLGSRASDVMGHGSRSRGADTSLLASIVEVNQDLGPRMELNSFPSSITASNHDPIAHHMMDNEEDIDCRQKYAAKCQMRQDDICEFDSSKACTIGGVTILETSYKPMNGGPPTTAPVRSDSLHHDSNGWSVGDPVDSHDYAEEEFQALNAYLESYDYEQRASRGNVPPHTPTGLDRPTFASNPGPRSNGLSSHHHSERVEATSLGNMSSSPSLTDILQSNTASSDGDNRDDGDIREASWNNDPRDRYLDAEPGFDDNVQAPTSPTQLRSSDSDSMVDEDDFRRAAERRGLSPDLVEVLISRSNNKIRRAPLKGVDELPPLGDNYRHHEVPIDSDTCRPASARHLRKDVGPDPYVFDQEASWNDNVEDEYNVPNPPPDCPPPDPSPGDPDAILSALQESAAEAYYNRRASLHSVPGMPELPEGASEEELNLLNRFIEVAASNFDGKKLSAESEKRVRAAAEKVGLSQKFVDQLLDQANANNEARNKAADQSPVASVGIPTSPLYDDLSTYYTNDKTQFTKRPSKRSRDPGCNAWESWEQLTNVMRQWANCGAPGDVHEEEEDYADRDDGSTIESDDRFRDELTKKLHRARKMKKKNDESRKSLQRGFV